MNKLALKLRRLTAFPQGYGAYFGEGMYCLAFSNHKWEVASLGEAWQAMKEFQFAEWEARNNMGDTRRSGGNR